MLARPLVFALPVALLACSTESVSAPTVSVAPKSAPTPAAEPPAAPPPDVAATFVGEFSRDPFQAYFDAAAHGIDLGDRARGPLERFGLDQLHLEGTITHTARPSALIKGPDGLGHVATIGTLIGKNRGQIRAIRGGEVLIRETYRTYDGRRVHQDLALKLHRPLALLDPEARGR